MLALFFPWTCRLSTGLFPVDTPASWHFELSMDSEPVEER
jgi:hypothetical protein